MHMSLRVGSTVRIVGLAGRADLNGQRARCINFDAAAARWAVRCIDSDEGVRVRPSNLELIAGSINGQDPQAVDALHERTAREAAEANERRANGAADYYDVVSIGLDAMNKGDLRAAKLALLDAIQQEPDDSEAYFHMAFVLARTMIGDPFKPDSEGNSGASMMQRSMDCEPEGSFKWTRAVIFLIHDTYGDALCTPDRLPDWWSDERLLRMADLMLPTLPQQMPESNRLFGWMVRAGILSGKWTGYKYERSEDQLRSAADAFRHAADACHGDRVRRTELLREAERYRAKALILSEAPTEPPEAALTAAQRARLAEVQRSRPPAFARQELPSNSPNGAIQGGSARVRGLAARPELNGAVGRLLAFDIERGRFTLAIGSDAIRVRPQNLEAVDRFPEPPCTFDSSAFCGALRVELTAAGVKTPLINLTPFIDGFDDMLMLYFFCVGNDPFAPRGGFNGCLSYVQRTPATEPFFLFVREVTMSAVKDAAAPPFLVVRPRGGGLAVPPGGGEVLDQAFALRFCLSQIAPTSTCPVCLEEIPTNEIDDRGAMGVINMFPCGHTLCRPCTARLFQPRVPGVTCPTCRQSWPNWSTGSAASGGGSILCEIPT